MGRQERLFVADLTSTARRMKPGAVNGLPPQPMVCINPEITWESKEIAEFEEGCLSVPDLNETIARPDRIFLRYLDRTFQEQEIEVRDALASVLQHEYDHLEGILFIDYLSPLRRRLLKRRLQAIANGNAETDYPLATTKR